MILQSWWNAHAIRGALPEVLAFTGEPRATPPDTSQFATVLRSQELAAAAQEVFPREMATPWSKSVREAFKRFRSLRRQLTRRDNPGSSHIGRELSRPRSLLLFRWELNISDGVSESESYGLVTEANFPPWDLWVAIVIHSKYPCLVSFAPEWAASAIDGAISVTAYDDLAWGFIHGGRLRNYGWGDIWGHTWDYKRKSYVRNPERAA